MLKFNCNNFVIACKDGYMSFPLRACRLARSLDLQTCYPGLCDKSKVLKIRIFDRRVSCIKFTGLEKKKNNDNNF